jgi:hypothetical protein
MKAVLAAAAVALLFAGVAEAKTKDKDKEAPVASEPLNAAVPAYAAFQSDVQLINGGSIKDPKDIERALDKAAAINRDALTRGFMAYGALTTARNATFVGEVRKISAYYGRDKAIQGFVNSARYAPGLPGGSQAIGALVKLANSDAERIISAGDSVKNRAREAQNLAWGKAQAGAAKPRMTRLKALAAATAPGVVAPEVLTKLKVGVGSGDPIVDPTTFGGASFWHTLNAPPTLVTATPTPTPATANLASLPIAQPAVTWSDTAGGADIRAKMLTLAALYALDATTERAADTDRLLNDNITNGCLQGAQLQFYQCVASAKFNYENMACIGEAGLQTVGSCVKDVAK